MASTLIPTIPQMIESLSKLHQKLSSALHKPTTNPQAAASDGAEADADASESDADASDAAAGDQIEETQDHQAETTASTEATQKLQKLLVNIEHLKGALEKTNELDKKLNEPIRSIKASLEEVIKRIESNGRTENDLNVKFLDAISKDLNTLKFQIPSYKKLSLAGTTAHLVDSGTGTAKQNEFRLPNLFGHKVFDESPAFKEIKVIYNGFDDDCKKCFLYFAVFPENVVFKKRFLTYWWIGEGLLNPSVIEELEWPEVRTGKILEKFAEKGLIVPVKEDQKKVKKKFRMPPIVRSAAIKLAKENDFMDYDPGNNPIAKSSGCDRIFLVKGGGSHPPEVPTALMGTKVPMAPKEVKAPMGTTAPMGAKAPAGMTAPTDAKAPTGTTVPTDKMDQKLEEGIKSIFNVSQPFPDSALEWLAKKGVVDTRTVKVVEWLLKLKNLEVLYLGRWQSAVDEQQIEVESYEFLKGLKKMKKLRLLSLQGISWINKLPNSLRTLSELRVLDLKSCFNLEKLPQGIGSLKNLTHLDVSGCYMLNEMPKSISKLTELTVLKGFITGRSNLKDLKGLKKLRKLSISISRPNFPEEMDLHVLQELGKYGELRSLTIMWGAGGVKQPSSGEGVKQPSSGEGVKQPSTGEGVKQPSSGEEVEEPSSAVGVKQPSSGEGVKQPSSGEGVKEPSSAERVKQPSSGKRNMIRQKTKKLLPEEPEKLEVQCLPMELEKLEVQCLPEEKLPQWLNPSNLESLKRLYIRGGKLAELGDAQWKAEVVRLKYMTNLKIEWRELLKSFPNLSYLQKVRCPRVTFCPCDANGVWMKP